MLKSLLKEIKRRIAEEPLFVAINIGLVFVVIGFAFLMWFFVAETIQKRAASGYIVELIKVKSLSGEEYSKKLEENFKEWKHPYFRGLWGFMLLEEKQKSGTFEEKVKIAETIIATRGVPKAAKDGLATYLAQLKFANGKGDEVVDIANKSLQKNVFAPMIMEVKFMSLIKDGKKEEASVVYKEISKTESGVNDRVAELLYISTHQPYILVPQKH